MSKIKKTHEFVEFAMDLPIIRHTFSFSVRSYSWWNSLFLPFFLFFGDFSGISRNQRIWNYNYNWFLYYWETHNILFTCTKWDSNPVPLARYFSTLSTRPACTTLVVPLEAQIWFLPKLYRGCSVYFNAGYGSCARKKWRHFSFLLWSKLNFPPKISISRFE